MSEDYAALLDVLEYGDYSDLSAGELREMCILSLQDLESEEAAYYVLRHKMSDVLKEGQLRNLSEEMKEEKLWEEYADHTLHERFFIVGSLLYKVSPSIFPKPDAVALSLEVTAMNSEAGQALARPVSESLLVRLLADGMETNAILHRLFGDQLSGKSFPDADKIVWTVRSNALAQDKMQIEVTGSGYWLDPLGGTRSYTSNAYADIAEG